MIKMKRANGKTDGIIELMKPKGENNPNLSLSPWAGLRAPKPLGGCWDKEPPKTPEILAEKKEMKGGLSGEKMLNCIPRRLETSCNNNHQQN